MQVGFGSNNGRTRKKANAPDCVRYNIPCRSAEKIPTKPVHADAKPQDALCLILDIHLEGESGFDLKRQLSLSAPTLPVIFITGRDCTANREAAQKVGGAAYLPKPFESKALLDALEIAIRTRS
jgi:FixJ family two-component response regulator